MSGKSTIVSLTGGLGNQLFQLAAGLSVSSQNSLSLEWSLGKPRLNNLGFPELDSYSLPGISRLEKAKKCHVLFSKTAGYFLRQGVEPRKYENLLGFKYLTRIATSLVLSLYFRRRVAPFSIDGVGFTDLSSQNKRNLLIGYFQSSKWMETSLVSLRMRELRLNVESSEVRAYKLLAETENPLIVHIRLGDYREEDAFGIPHVDYYRTAINNELRSNLYSKIWAFSDEPLLAKEVLKEFDSDLIRWIPEIADSASQTFEVMRFGRGYVIANSSFSWWGAMLSYNLDARVIAPTPWFKKMKEPSYLVPPHWTRLPAWGNSHG